MAPTTLPRRRLLSSWQLRRPLTIILAAMLFSGQAAAGLQQTYCSSQNTADTPSSDSEWQSLGLCKTTCSGSYAIAIVLGSSCWCSNYVPGDQASLSDCSDECHGYPYEQCGNQDQSLYGYMVLDQNAIAGTQGASASSSAPQTTSPSRQTTHGSTHATTRTTLSSSSTSTTATWTPKAVTTVQILTISNTPVTHTVTSMPTVASGGDSASPSRVENKGVSGGLIAGVVIGTIAGMLILGALLFFCWRRRRQHQEATGAEAGTGTPGSEKRPTRNISVLSKQGLLEKVYPSAAAAQRSHATSNNHSLHTLGNGHDPSGGQTPMNERRNSRPLFYDQRLNPTALMDIDNVSRVSVNTLPDNRDFSRTLNVTNPDLHNWD